MPLTDLLLTILLTSLFCCGLSIITSDGMIGHPIRYAIERQINLIRLNNLKAGDITAYWFKPILLCCACMGSFWGIIIFVSLHGFHLGLIKYICICCVCSSFVNAFFISKYNQ